MEVFYTVFFFRSTFRNVNRRLMYENFDACSTPRIIQANDFIRRQITLENN